MTHPRLSVHNVSFLGMSFSPLPLEELNSHWQALGVSRLSLIGDELFAGGADVIRGLMDRHGYTVETVTHVFCPGALPTDADGIAHLRSRLSALIPLAAGVGARSIYMLTGGRGQLRWERAAELFCEIIAPCAREAEQAGIRLAVENASNLYVDCHLAHTLRDTITLAEMADIGICIDQFHCWTEAGFSDLLARALPRTVLVQISDYVLGDRRLPARAVPGDGGIPIEPFIAEVLAGGYANGFDLELLGPRIETEGRIEAVRRACDTVSAMLERLGG